VVAALLVLVVAVGATALFGWARADSACGEGDFISSRFGYCVRTPPGWEAAPAEGDDTLDRFLLRNGAATITVTAVSLEKGQDLARFEQFVRGYVDGSGAVSGDSSPVEVDGVEGVAFEATLQGLEGTTRSREVLFAREGIAWRVTLADDEASFEASAARLDQLLSSWRFS
jgi:hypothetical protein